MKANRRLDRKQITNLAKFSAVKPLDNNEH